MRQSTKIFGTLESRIISKLPMRQSTPNAARLP